MDAPYRCLRACRASPPAGVGPEGVPLTPRELNPPIPKRETTLTIALQTLTSSQFLPPYDPVHIVSGTHSVYVARYVVQRCARRLELDHLAPHDLCRTCAKLRHV